MLFTVSFNIVIQLVPLVLSVGNEMKKKFRRRKMLKKLKLIQKNIESKYSSYQKSIILAALKKGM